MVIVRPCLDWHLPYYLSTLVGIFAICCVEFYNQPILHIWVYYVLFPIIDLVLGDDNVNPTPEEEKILKKQFRWQLPVATYIALEWFAFFWSFSYLQRTELSIFQFVLFAISMGHVNAGGILISHEIIHKKSQFLKIVGTFDLVKSLNMHYYLEHIYGHHKHVATPIDPATARYNQTVSQFIGQSLKGGFINAWRHQVKKMKKQKKSVYSFDNKMIQFISLELVFSSFILYVFGPKCFLFFVVRAFVSVSMLETANYIRHYGLERKKLETGEYEPVTTKHSWNAPQFFQNFFLFKLQRHSDHHANAHKPYQILSSAPDAPCLPCGYQVCFLACQFPSFWFKIINPLVESTNNDGKPSKEQIEKSGKALRTWLAYQFAFVSVLTYSVVFIIS